MEKKFRVCYYQAMKKGDFNSILHKLSLQKGEEKLRLAFKLNQFVVKLQKEGELYASRQSIARSRTAS